MPVKDKARTLKMKRRFQACQYPPPHLWNQRGNALFLILIAVALFAALSYAITQSGRGGGSISKEQNKILAAQLVQISDDIRLGVQRMILSGTAVNDIIVGDPPNTPAPGYGPDNGAAAFCTTGSTCLFAPEGGGVQIPQMPREAFLSDSERVATGTGFGNGGYFEPNGLNGISIQGFMGSVPLPRAVSGAGTAAADDILEIIPVRKEVCEEINKGLGLTTTDPDAMNYDNLPLAEPTACANVSSVGGPGIYAFWTLLNAR